MAPPLLWKNFTFFFLKGFPEVFTKHYTICFMISKFFAPSYALCIMTLPIFCICIIVTTEEQNRTLQMICGNTDDDTCIGNVEYLRIA